MPKRGDWIAVDDVDEYVRTHPTNENKTTYGEVAEKAHDTVLAVLFDGDIRGKTGWDKKTVLHHLYRAANHITLCLIGNHDEDHIAHAQTRLAMASYLLNKAIDAHLRDDHFSEGGAY